MAKKAEKVDPQETLERTVYVPGWAYNFMIERASRQPWRNVKSELSQLVERAIRAEMQAEGKEPGNSLPARKAA